MKLLKWKVQQRRIAFVGVTGFVYIHIYECIKQTSIFKAIYICTNAHICIHCDVELNLERYAFRLVAHVRVD